MSLIDYARKELELAGMMDEDKEWWIRDPEGTTEHVMSKEELEQWYKDND